MSINALQYVERTNDLTEATRMLAALKQLDTCIGGRVTDSPKWNEARYLVQVFFALAPRDSGAAWPNGVREVTVLNTHKQSLGVV